jgi:hypothetical protein
MQDVKWLFHMWNMCEIPVFKVLAEHGDARCKTCARAMSANEDGAAASKKSSVLRLMRVLRLRLVTRRGWDR